MKLKEIKNWNAEIESSITKAWKNSSQYKFNPKTKKKIYSIDTPPPYVNTPIHMGHAVTYCYMDFFARYKRMQGFEVLFPLGLDRNGLPIEMAAEKKFNISALKVGRKKFIEYCEKLLKESSEESIDSFVKLGISFNSYKKGKELGDIYLTDSPEYRTLTQTTFIDLYKKGLIYEDSRINNWDPKLQTTIADSEIEYKEIQSNFNDIKWKVRGTNKEIIIGTTRPELICTCGMIIFNPKDKRYKHLEGKTAISPLFNEEIPIKAHPLADPEKGTGIAMMCSAGDLSDIQFFREQKIKPRIAINKDGTMNKHSKFLEGLKVKQARETIIEKLKKEKLLNKQTKIVHRTPVSERSGAEIEFIEMPEFYLQQLKFIPKIKEIIKKIDFYPKNSKKILDDWIKSVSIDWPISRRRYYATPTPLWKSEDGKYIAIPPIGKYYQPWKENPPKNSEIYKNGKLIGKISDKKFKSLKWKGEERVLDTWFDSSISELNMIKHPSEFSKKAYPVTLRPQGKEIVRTWLYYTILRGYLETKKPAFKEVWIHQHILDGKGRKMSKSLGNIIDPQNIIKNEGAEALRLWSAREGNLAKQDLSCSRERIKAEQKTINKLLNITKFVTQFKKPLKKPDLTETDKIFLDNIGYEIHLINQSYDRYDFYKPAITLRNFLWETFASHYIELIKKRVYNQEGKFKKQESNSAIYTLYKILEELIIVLHPIIPQVTSVIANELKISFNKFPKGIEKPDDAMLLVNEIERFNREIWKTKQKLKIPLRDPIKDVSIPLKLRRFEKDLKACHNLI